MSISPPQTSLQFSLQQNCSNTSNKYRLVMQCFFSLGVRTKQNMRKSLPDIFICEIEVAWLQRLACLRSLLACQASVWAMCEDLQFGMSRTTSVPALSYMGMILCLWRSACAWAAAGSTTSSTRKSVRQFAFTVEMEPSAQSLSARRRTLAMSACSFAPPGESVQHKHHAALKRRSHSATGSIACQCWQGLGGRALKRVRPQNAEQHR